MPESGHPASEAHLHRALNLRDVVLLNIACIVGLSSLAQVAQFGFASMPLYLLAVLTFLVPSGLMVAELNARMPEEGGFYLWTRTAFGDIHGYIAAWTYWLSNIVWFPTVLLLVSVSILYIGGEGVLARAEDPVYNGTVCLAILWSTTLLNILGIEKAKWIQNVGAWATWAVTALLVLLGTIFVSRFGSVHPFTAGKLVPDFTNLDILPFFGVVAFCFGGLELAPVMAGEIQDPKRTILRAMVRASIAVTLIYMLCTLVLIFTVEEGGVGIIEGVAQSFFEMGRALGIPAIGVVGALLVTASSLGLFGSWMTGTARVPFVIGLDHYLPDALARVHPRWGSPWVSLLMQAGVVTSLFLASIVGSTVKDAFLVLLDMSIILYFIPFLYMFAALAWHVRNGTGEGAVSAFRRPGPPVWLVACSGFAVTLFSAVISAVPSGEVENRGLFVLKVVGGAAVLIGAGLVVYFAKHAEVRARRQAEDRL